MFTPELVRLLFLMHFVRGILHLILLVLFDDNVFISFRMNTVHRRGDEGQVRRPLGYRLFNQVRIFYRFYLLFHLNSLRDIAAREGFILIINKWLGICLLGHQYEITIVNLPRYLLWFGSEWPTQEFLFLLRFIITYIITSFQNLCIKDLSIRWSSGHLHHLIPPCKLL
jgi:hypothetical protein